MKRKQMTWKEARWSARHFVWEVGGSRRQWTIDTAEGYLPSAWRLPNDVTDDQFFPITIEHVAHVFRQLAVPQ